MKAKALLFLLAPVTFCIPHLLSAQQGAGSAAEGNMPRRPLDSGPNQMELVPTVDLQFKTGEPIPGLTASPAIAMPVQCSSDGTALIQMLMPPEFREIALYLVRTTGSTQISLKGVPGISTPQPVDVFASESLIGVLLYATKNAADSSATKSPGFFLAEFEPNGVYKRLVEMSPPEMFFRFALLPSGDLLTLEFDPGNEVTRLSLRDSSGVVKREIPVPEGLQNIPSTSAGETDLPTSDQETLKGSASVGRARFTPSGEKVILWMPGKSTVAEFGPGDSVREVKIELPKGYNFDGFFPSTDRWIVRFRRSGLSDSEPVDMRAETKNFLIYEVLPSDGSLRRRLNQGSDAGWLACEKDGVLTIFKTDEKQHLIPLTADLGK